MMNSICSLPVDLTDRLGFMDYHQEDILKLFQSLLKIPKQVTVIRKKQKQMLNTSYGFIPWDDAHHPELSMTDGIPDGRFIFINGNNTPRVAKIDLKRI